MSDPNFGFTGVVPLNVSVAANIASALYYQSTHTVTETYNYFYETFRNNSDNHLPWNQSEDYKQLGSVFEDFGNFNYAVVGKALGYSDNLIRYAAGYAQGRSDGLGENDAILRALKDFRNKGDNPEDQVQINAGINAAKHSGFDKNDFGIPDAAILEWEKAKKSKFKVINFGVSSSFNTFANSPQRSDPFTLDLNSNGIETVGISTTHPILFDIDADGVKTSTGWIAPSDGLLVLDRNGNGTIDSGRELFGDATLKSNGQLAADGFDAIADQDTNHDGKISSLDANWNTLRVWRDLNQDGLSQSNELTTLSSLGIASINVTGQAHSTLLDNGNVLANLGTFTYANGTNGTAGTAANLADVNLVQDTFTSQFTTHIPLTTLAATLPNLKGSGQVRDLRKAVNDKEWRLMA